MGVFDRIMGVNVKARYDLSKLCHPFLKQSIDAFIIL